MKTLMVAAAFCVSLSTAAAAQVGSFSQGFYDGFSQGMALGNNYVPCCHTYHPEWSGEAPMPIYNPPVYYPPPPNCITIRLGQGMYTTSCQ
jgi:hypothetical protein